MFVIQFGALFSIGTEISNGQLVSSVVFFVFFGGDKKIKSSVTPLVVSLASWEVNLDFGGIEWDKVDFSNLFSLVGSCLTSFKKGTIFVLDPLLTIVIFDFDHVNDSFGQFPLWMLEVVRSFLQKNLSDLSFLTQIDHDPEVSLLFDFRMTNMESSNGVKFEMIPFLVPH